MKCIVTILETVASDGYRNHRGQMRVGKRRLDEGFSEEVILKLGFN
jgi:hypothetical protein